MTLDSARTIALQVAQHYDKPFAIWRMPAWREEVYAVITPERVPTEGKVIEVVQSKAQGSLF